MKTIVLDWDAFEPQIKPQPMLDEYRRMIDEELSEFLQASDLSVSVCPGCRSGKHASAFERSGLAYVECLDCGSVYASPRPSEESLVRFFRESKSARFWRERILPETRALRREKLFRPRAQWLLDVVDEYRPETRLAVAIGYHNDLLLEELAAFEKSLFRVVVTNPLGDIEFADTSLPSVEIRPMALAEVPRLGPVDVFLAFDIIDRSADLETLFGGAGQAIGSGGLLLATTTLISGFDLQVLWDRSTSIYPPERLNLLSVEGLTALFERHGFEALEFSTPGMFDVELVKRAIEAEPGRDWPRFIRYLMLNRDVTALEDFQDFLQRHRLSSFARIVLRKI